MDTNESLLHARLESLSAGEDAKLLRNGQRGLEKETLRVDRNGQLAMTPHPAALGSPLTHAYLTTDYSEALLEFVTPPTSSNEAALAFLSELHVFVHRHLGDELLWPPSMPCVINADEAVPIAQYGSSNAGRFRSVYRSGLGYRYGRAMQAIAGAHFNYSLPAAFWPRYREIVGSENAPADFKSEQFMHLVRNYRRTAWIVAYLYGASPAFCKSFRPQGHPRLESLNAHTWYAPFATSLRMSDMGYRNTTQARLRISADSLERYVAELKHAITTPNPDYERIGVEVDGEYRQLNANMLQIENEYYSSIRPKPADRTLRPTAALARDGIEYVEIRTLDLNPFAPAGVGPEQMRLLELLLIRCLLADSPLITEAEQDEIDARELTVAWEGRRPGLVIVDGGRSVPLAEHGAAIVDELEACAGLLEDAPGPYLTAVREARAALAEPDRTPSARLLAALAERGQSFFDYGLTLAQQQQAHFRALPGEPSLQARLDDEAARSLAATAALESEPRPPFGEYLARYFAE